MEIAEDTEVLNAVVFDKQSVSGFDESFWKINGLLSKCSSARNVGAVNILLTVICALCLIFFTYSVWIFDL